MTLLQVRNLITKLPAKLAAFTAPAYQDDLAWFRPEDYVEPAKKVHDLYRESLTLQLPDDQREILRRRMTSAAGIIQRIIDLYDLNGHCNCKAAVLKQLEEVFEDMASTLGISPQELQNATLSKA